MFGNIDFLIQRLHGIHGGDDLEDDDEDEVMDNEPFFLGEDAEEE